ncbi:hypothetical protein EDD90_3286 [Streptomyces sp. Ag109_O5-1]|uniref:hypothetical protein n=1 Tax=Streptomyces sp. Ag109_O5-1 TaxID=1938851 RepID=UPI000F4F5BDA|nr:hypothetical protein [Streptomyces sp. Ag109_O5-1]RPE40250.1 hypothetical protein EDD90_3286 [Streptomyces sp. Ag109_O5-1]
MSAGEQPATEAAVEETEPDAEPRQMSERTAKAIVVVVAAGAVWGLVVAFPWIAYVIVGVLGTLGWQKIRGWIGHREGSGEEADADETDAVQAAASLRRELVSALHAVGAPHAHITALAEHLGAPNDRVRTALNDAGIPISGGVRMKGRKVAVSPGVKREDFPPLPSPDEDGSVEGVLTSNNNSNNAYVLEDDDKNPVRTHVRWRAG